MEKLGLMLVETEYQATVIKEVFPQHKWDVLLIPKIMEGYTDIKSNLMLLGFTQERIQQLDMSVLVVLSGLTREFVKSKYTYLGEKLLYITNPKCYLDIECEKCVIVLPTSPIRMFPSTRLVQTGKITITKDAEVEEYNLYLELITKLQKGE